MANNNQIYKMSNAGGFKSLTRYYDMLAGNTTWNPWEPQGAFDALATVTVPSGGLSNITFAGIPAGYKHLQLRGIVKTTNTGAGSNMIIRANSDTSSNYTFHQLFADGASVGSNGSASTTFITANQAPGTTANMVGVTVIDILDYANTSKNKTFRTLGGWDLNGSGNIQMRSGAWLSTSAITSLTCTIEGYNFGEYSQLALYGVK